MKIAIEGCAHGELEQIYETIGELERRQGCTVDLLLCCGDFQSTRNMEDLECMAVPRKFMDMCSFYKYYSGEKVAPILTIFIGGNHEASNYLQELPYGGWVAPNIYYLGYAGVVNVNGVRIGGISGTKIRDLYCLELGWLIGIYYYTGIYKGLDYYKGHFEIAPYDDSTKRSVYHVRQLEVFRLKQIKSKVDIMLSHDWPREIYHFGDSDQLCRFKPHFQDEIANNTLGSRPCQDLLNHIRPDYWFSAHLHCKFSAVVQHNDPPSLTKFLALDKCLPKRRFLQLLDVPTENSSEPLRLSYDLEWLAILCSTKHLIDVKRTTNYMPGPESPYRFDFTPTEEEKNSVLELLSNNLVVPLNFTRTAEPYNPQEPQSPYRTQPKAQLNPQTTLFCELLDIDDPISLLMVLQRIPLNHSSYRDKDSSFGLDDSLTDTSLNTTSDSFGSTPQRTRTQFSLPEPLNGSEKNPEKLSLYNDDFQESEPDNDSHLETSALNSSSLNSTVSTSFTHIRPLQTEEKSDAEQIDSSGSAESNKSLSDVAALLTDTVKIMSPDSSLTEKTKANSNTDDIAAPVESPPKKFKRRNQEIYAAQDDEWKHCD